jgi:hypothetical protein
MQMAKPQDFPFFVEKKWNASGPVQSMTNIGRSEQKREGDIQTMVCCTAG